jgi:hypothetical protein
MITLADAILAASFAVDVVCGHQLVGLAAPLLV